MLTPESSETSQRIGEEASEQPTDTSIYHSLTDHR